MRGRHERLGSRAARGELARASAACALFVAPNFALGAVLMMRLAAEAARHLPRAEIVELHGEGKKDAPSGTARATAEAARRRAGALGRLPGPGRAPGGALRRRGPAADDPPRRVLARGVRARRAAGARAPRTRCATSAWTRCSPRPRRHGAGHSAPTRDRRTDRLGGRQGPRARTPARTRSSRRSASARRGAHRDRDAVRCGRERRLRPLPRSSARSSSTTARTVSSSTARRARRRRSREEERDRR